MKTRTRVVAWVYVVLHSLTGIAMIYPVATRDLGSICIVFMLTSLMLAAVWGGLLKRNRGAYWVLLCLYTLSTAAIAVALLQNWLPEPRALFEVVGTVVALIGLCMAAAPLGWSMALYFIALLLLHGLPIVVLLTDRPSGWRQSENQPTSCANEKR